MKRDIGAKANGYLEVAPNAARTMAALREMGYDSFSAIMDLIDNGVDAGATSIEVTIKGEGKSIYVDILDDGRGMDAETLAEALRLGSDTDHNAQKDLGKFGLGLNTASISLARRIWIVTREAGKTAVESTLDLDVIEAKNSFVITQPKPASGKVVQDTVRDHGTLVRLERIDRINDTNPSRFAANLRERLGQVYRHFLAKGMKLMVNNRHVTRYDPLMLDHPETETVLNTTLDLGDGTKATLKVVELPDLGTEGDVFNKIFPHNSGFYVCRNDREIIAGSTFGFYRHHHSYSHFRAELSYTGNSKVFHEDVKKSSIHPDDKLLKKLKDMTEKYWIQSGRQGRERGVDVPVKLHHGSSEEAINAKLATMAPAGKGGNGKPAKKAEATKQAAAAPAAPRIRFSTFDGSRAGRWFTTESKAGGEMVVCFNTKHPAVRAMSEIKHSQASTLLHSIVAAIARAEVDLKDDGGLLERAGDYLAVLTAHTD